MAGTTKRYAVVTGANKGIGLEVCRQLASNGIVVILTARDEKRGLEALQKLKESSGYSDDQLVFHQLDVSDLASIASLVDFVKTHFGKLDILVNNAGVSGAKPREHVNSEYLKSTGFGQEGVKINWSDIQIETPDAAEECLKINYYGAKNMVEEFIPLLQLSNSPRIVNVSSGMGRLKSLSNEWAIGVLSDAENLTEQRIDEVLNEYLKDFREGLAEKKDWPAFLSAYILSKAAMNAYTRIVAKKYPEIRINSVCPGFVKTDINLNSGFLSVEEGADSVVRLTLLSNDGPSGCYFMRKEVSDF